MTTSAIDLIMSIYKYRQIDLANDLKIKPYHVCRWLKTGIVPPQFILKVIQVAMSRDTGNKLPAKHALAIRFLRDHEKNHLTK